MGTLKARRIAAFLVKRERNPLSRALALSPAVKRFSQVLLSLLLSRLNQNLLVLLVSIQDIFDSRRMELRSSLP